MHLIIAGIMTSSSLRFPTFSYSARSEVSPMDRSVYVLVIASSRSLNRFVASDTDAKSPDVLSFDLLGVIVEGHPLQHGIAFHQAAQSIDTVVEVVFDLVEITFVFIGDLRRNIALADPVHIFLRPFSTGRSLHPEYC